MVEAQHSPDIIATETTVREDTFEQAGGNGQFWEPWTPVVGQRVRIRLSGECRADWASLPRSTTLGRIDWPGHIRGEDGRVGTVDTCTMRACPLCNDGLLGHRFTVEFDSPLYWRDHEWPGGHYAACELEPLSVPPPPLRITALYGRYVEVSLDDWATLQP